MKSGIVFYPEITPQPSAEAGRIRELASAGSLYLPAGARSDGPNTARQFSGSAR